MDFEKISSRSNEKVKLFPAFVAECLVPQGNGAVCA